MTEKLGPCQGTVVAGPSGARCDTCRARHHGNVGRQCRKLGRPQHPVCEDCGSRIEPSVCWCGEPFADHSYSSNHSPVVMGCTCHKETR